MGQHRQGLQSRKELRLQDADTRRDLALEPDRIRPLCKHAARHDRSHVGRNRRRIFAGGYALRRIVRKPDRVLEAHRPQRRTAAQARVALRSGGRPGRRFVLHREPHAVDRRRGVEALPRNRGEGRLHRSLQGRLHRRAHQSVGCSQGQEHRNAPPDTARRQPVSQLYGGRRQGDHRRVRYAQAGRGQRARSLPRRHGVRGDAPAWSRRHSC